MSSKVRILIIDDEAAVRDVLTMNLRAQGYEIERASSGAEGLQKAGEFHPHLVILDLGLPDRSGELVLKDLRRWTQVPILVLTVTDDENVKVKLLDAGADDYLTKPFGPMELLARVRVGLRHRGMMEATPVFESGDLRIDLNERTVSCGSESIKLTNTEFELLACLVRERGKVVPQAQLLKQVWGAATPDQSHYLRIYVNQLRKKLEKEPSAPKHILTEPGVGYRLI